MTEEEQSNMEASFIKAQYQAAETIRAMDESIDQIVRAQEESVVTISTFHVLFAVLVGIFIGMTFSLLG